LLSSNSESRFLVTEFNLALLPVYLSKFSAKSGAPMGWDIYLVTKFNLIRVFQALLDDSTHEAELLVQALPS